ncbi:hypothetical protein [Clostridium algidicarnis]|uniref:hypothetical protein n=1 Tax=Clostridium algidicarnis TaxID=37659 RepID=UPI003FD6C63E
MSKIKHIPTDEVHVLKSDGKTTMCGVDTTKNSDHWEDVGNNSKVTCDKNGCK